MTPIVSVIIVGYNSKNELEACLESVQKQNVPCEVFVVDNASTDESQKLVKELSGRWGAIIPILNEKNMGLAYANNQPLDQCLGKYVLILNPDTIMQNGSLAAMIEYLDQHGDVGALGPMSFFESGLPHVSYHYSWTIWHVIFWRVFPNSIVRLLYDRVFAQYRERNVLFVSGACLLAPTALLQSIGGYDPNYFLSIEDVVDLCSRIRERGFRVVFYPRARIVHAGGRSNKQAKMISLYMIHSGALYFFWKHKGSFQTSVLQLIFTLNLWFRAFVCFLLIPLNGVVYRDRMARYSRVAKDIFRLRFDIAKTQPMSKKFGA